ncbi:hypothetical protein CSC67_08505 [Pusillimonas caeni]|uniref:hypothetical protein n=1 Tax=Pusillimonas caeni TaxID=1348472 RepID=UPI000E59A931|nr:hypothetical protein [Pusillimonas caeni]TFL14183.1 hypothetical protein CSC67_08505 [Pusillimonas caeni]
MTTETKILTDECIFALAAETDITSINPNVDVLMFSRDEMLKAGRAIEQAVLQSPEVQTLRRKSARYDWLTRNAYIGECYTHEGTILEVQGTDRQVPIDSTVDAAIDAAMEKQP